MTKPSGQEQRYRLVRGAFDVMFAMVCYAALAMLVVVIVLWVSVWSQGYHIVIGSHVIIDGVALWRIFAVALLCYWVGATVRLTRHLVHRRKWGTWLLAKRRYLVNKGLDADARYLAVREFVFGPSPFKWLTWQASIAAALSIVFVVFVNNEPLDGWVRAVIVVSILALLALPVGVIGSFLDRKLARSDYTLANDV